MSYSVVETDSLGLLGVDSFQDESKALEVFDGLLDYYKPKMTLEEIALVLKNRKFEKDGYKIEIVEGK